MKQQFNNLSTTPFWWEAAPPEDGLGADALMDCDILIIGAGFTGLNAAITLAEYGAGKIVVVDKMRLGEGASSRNGGQLRSASKSSDEQRCKRFGREIGLRVAEDFRASLPFFLERVRTLGIECHVDMSGLLMGAHTTAHYKAGERRWQSLADEQKQREWPVSPDRMQEEIATGAYRGGYVSLDAGLVHPALYHKGLRDRARALGVSLHSGVEMVKITRGRRDFRVHFAGNRSIQAQRIISGPNGYVDAAQPWLQRRLVPVQSYMIATEELDEDLVSALIPKDRAVADTKKVLNYYRKSPDGRRVLFGGRVSFAAIDEHQSAAGLYKLMTAVFPQIKGCKLTHSWRGNVAFTLDWLPYIGCHDGVYYACGYNGNGVVMGSYLGDRIARMVLADGKSVYGLDQIRFSALPGYAGNPWFLPVVGTAYRAQDHLSRMLDRGWPPISERIKR
ncbi:MULTISPECIES: FAD-binding oxidoreductase [unclassified Rhizobium]|uniref:NAD(P)/FAD-dependent oxidoreductase n=1 Tax=unclassified Rhizobium TaxID=2613769 RepID=UPI0006FA1BEB|nr:MULTISPECIES: FAD-binding oxidoreductase [unclassified Rhizobium]KQV41775.1 hypothetical protein ASC86_20410 [Rhizobium sp. Root1212]KRD30016.1 hypothetical protein ASE37_23900 [Rhizobium sp. Root268]